MPIKETDVKKQVPNPTGKGGLGDRPQDINRKGRTDNCYSWRAQFIKIAQEKKGNVERIEHAARKMWDKMEEEGDVRAFEKIADRMEGKVPQPLGQPDEDGEMVVKIKMV